MQYYYLPEVSSEPASTILSSITGGLFISIYYQQGQDMVELIRR